MTGLALDYSFSPDPVEATTELDLTVTASSQPGQSSDFSQITIFIPVGSYGDGGSLSDNRWLPQPAWFSGGVVVTVSRDDPLVTIRAKDSAAFSVPPEISFTLPGIRVSSVPGVVRITVTETPADGGEEVTGIRKLKKSRSQANPIASFTATPSVISQLRDLDQPVTLTWTTNRQALAHPQDLVYAVGIVDEPSGIPGAQRPPSYSGFRDCLGGGYCYSEQDGRDGVLTPPVSATTVFQLTAVTAQDVDSRRQVAAMPCRVDVAVPAIVANTAYNEQLPLASGRLVSLHWKADHADHCDVIASRLEPPVVRGAPTDTFRDGLMVVLPQAPGPHLVSVVPQSASGSGALVLLPPEIEIRSPYSIELPGATPTTQIVGLSAAASAGRAAAALYDPATRTSTLAIIDITSHNATPAALEGPALNFSDWQGLPDTSSNPSPVAMSPDGSKCYALTGPPPLRNWNYYCFALDVMTGHSNGFFPVGPSKPAFPFTIAAGDGQYAIFGYGELSDMAWFAPADAQPGTGASVSIHGYRELESADGGQWR